MTQFTIHLNTLSEMKTYAAMLEKCTCTGYAVSADFSIPADDILQLFPRCSLPDLKLFFHSSKPENLLSLQEYLEANHLLVS